MQTYDYTKYSLPSESIVRALYNRPGLRFTALQDAASYQNGTALIGHLRDLIDDHQLVRFATAEIPEDPEDEAYTVTDRGARVALILGQISTHQAAVDDPTPTNSRDIAVLLNALLDAGAASPKDIIEQTPMAPDDVHRTLGWSISHALVIPDTGDPIGLGDSYQLTALARDVLTADRGLPADLIIRDGGDGGE